MPRRIAILTATVFVIAITVVALRHEGRLLAGQFQSLQGERDALNIEWGKLLLEEGAWSEHRRIESLARTRLGMTTPDAKGIVVIDLRQGVEQ